MSESNPFLKVTDVYKSFSHVQALRGVDFCAYQGEILAIVGDNGAGKSTLIKILSGVLDPDRGKIEIAGSVYMKLTPKSALDAGISTVYQDLALADSRDVAANIFLGRELMKGPFLDKRAMYRQSEALISDLHINIPNVRVEVSILSGGQRQGTAVARAIHQGGKMFIFDEPTAAMGLNETAAVLKLIKKLAADGFGVILISHNMQQVFQISDRICVMRQGKVVEMLETAATNIEYAVSLITGAVNISAVQ